MKEINNEFGFELECRDILIDYCIPRWKKWFSFRGSSQHSKIQDNMASNLAAPVRELGCAIIAALISSLRILKVLFVPFEEKDELRPREGEENIFLIFDISI